MTLNLVSVKPGLTQFPLTENYARRLMDTKFMGFDERDLLRTRLLGELRHTELSLQELREAGEVFYQNSDDIGLYGLSPSELKEKECKIVGRTAVECKIDGQCRFISERLPAVLRSNYTEFDKLSIIDLFLGSGNLLYHITSRLNARIAIGFEADPEVFRRTQHNFNRIGFQANIFERTYQPQDLMTIPHDHIAIVILDPPWGRGFTFTNGLDLAQTDPPVLQVAESCSLALDKVAGLILIILCKEVTHENSVKEILARFHYVDRSTTTDWRRGSNTSFLICRR